MSDVPPDEGSVNPPRTDFPAAVSRRPERPEDAQTTPDAPAPPRRNPRRSWKRRLARALLIGFLLWAASGALAGYLLTHRRHAPYPEPAPAWTGVAVEDVRLTTDDGQQIGGWFVRPAAPHRVTVLLLHGKGASRRRMWPQMQWLAEQGYGAMAISLRAHGDSTGTRDDIGEPKKYQRLLREVIEEAEGAPTVGPPW